MIIEFQGTKNRGTGAGAAMVMAAAVEAFRTNKKVCIMSLRGHYPAGDVEAYAIPPEVDDGQNATAGIGLVDQFSFSDTGIDAVLRRADTGRLTTEMFDNCVTPTIRDKNGLDIVKTTKDSAFENDLMERFDTIQTILECANTTYDYVFVYVGPNHDDFLEKMGEIVDAVVIVARQGRADKISKTNEKLAKKVSLLITDYDAESGWTLRHLKKAYGINNIFTFPHNVRYHDAAEDGALIRFAMKNVHPDKNDYNYPLIEDLKSLLRHIDGKAEETQPDFTEEFEYVRAKKADKSPVLRRYEKQMETVTTKKKTGGGLFGIGSKVEDVESVKFGNGDTVPVDETKKQDNVPDVSTEYFDPDETLIPNEESAEIEKDFPKDIAEDNEDEVSVPGMDDILSDPADEAQNEEAMNAELPEHDEAMVSDDNPTNTDDENHGNTEEIDTEEDLTTSDGRKRYSGRKDCCGA
jgi:cellulose biosynthesis protein BcsQ